MATKTASAESVPSVSRPGVHIPENFEAVLKTGLDEVFKRELETPYEGMQFFKKKNMSKRSYKFQSYYGLGHVSQVTELENVDSDEIGLGFDWTLTSNIFKGEIAITKEMKEDELHGVIRDLQAELSESERYSKEIILADVFNRALGASGAPFLCEDGMYLGDESRPNPYALAGNWSNLEAAGDITASSIFQAQLNFAQNKDERGKKKPLKMKTLVIRPQDEETVWEILKSDKEPTSSLNKRNFQQDRFSYIVYNYLTSAVNVFIAEDKHGAKNELYFGDRVSPQVETYKDGNNPDVTRQRIRSRFGVGAGRPYNMRFKDVS